MSLRFEAWTPPTAAVFAKILDDVPVASGSGTVELSTYADETISVPIDVTVPAGSLIAAFDGTTLIDEFLLERSHRAVDSEGQPTKNLSGPQVNGLLTRLAVYPFDHPLMPSRFRDWIWDGDNLLPTGLAYTAERVEVWTTTPGTPFTLTFDGQTTSSISGSASATTVETAVEALSNILDVLVTGSGTAADHWLIEFVDPTGTIPNMTGTGGSLHVAVVAQGTTLPQRWTISQRIDRGVPVIHGAHASGSPSVVTDFVDSAEGASWSYRFDGTSQFSGVQIVVPVEESGLYQIRMRVAADNTTDLWRLVARDHFDQNPDDMDPDPPELGGRAMVAADTFETWTITDYQVPDGADEIILRFAYVGTGDPGLAWINLETGTYMKPGMAAATDGEIMRVLLEACQARGTGLWLDPDFTDLVDSLAVAWPATRALRAFPPQNLAHVAAALHQLGGNWEIRRKATPVGAFTHDLKLYAPDSHPDLTTGTVAVLTPPGGSVVDRLPDATVRLALGDGGLWAEHEDTAAVTAFGRWEKPYDAEHLLSEAALIDYLTALAADEQTNRTALQVTLYQNDQSVPLRDFRPGDIVPWLLAPILAPLERPVQTISWAQGDVAAYEVTGSRVFDDEAGLARAVEMLLDEVAPRPRPRLSAPTVTGGGLAPTIVFATTASSPDAQGRADYVFGIDDDANFAWFNEALARVDGDARFLFTEGEFNFGFNYPTIPAAAQIRFEGSGTSASFLQWVTDEADFLIIEGSVSFDHITLREIPGT